jgi:hypothetical protein
MKRRWKLLAVAAVPGVYWIDQCALPRPALVDAAFAVEGNPVAPIGVRLEHVAAKYLPVGMDEDAGLALVKKAGFRVTPELREPRIPSSVRPAIGWWSRATTRASRAAGRRSP